MLGCEANVSRGIAGERLDRPPRSRGSFRLFGLRAKPQKRKILESDKLSLAGPEVQLRRELDWEYMNVHGFLGQPPPTEFHLRPSESLGADLGRLEQGKCSDHSQFIFW